VITEIVKKAQLAQEKFEKFEQEAVDECVLAVGWALTNPKHNEALSKLAVSSTGLGNVADKIKKNYRKTLGLLHDLKGVKTCGVIDEDKKKKVIKIARPVGVVGVIVPSTNPLATPVNNIINALKCRNAIIVSPSPKGMETWEALYALIKKELKRVGAPPNIVQALPAPITKENTFLLMEKVDLIVCTGSQNNVRAAYSSGNIAIGVGTGNVPVIVDESADLKQAAQKITQSKTFDNSTSCSSENSLVVVDAIYKDFLKELQKCGAVLLDNKEKNILQKELWKGGKLNPNLLAKDFKELCKQTNLTKNTGGKFFLVTEKNVGRDFPFSGEKLSLVLTVYKEKDYHAAIKKVKKILEHQGKGHSIGIHTKKMERATELGNFLPVCRVIVNQPHCFAAGGSFSNGLPFSLSMGCGTWGKNSISSNLNYRHFLNITRLSFPFASEKKIQFKDIFGDFQKKYQL
jgi:sulfoacetaldehyde dehydrogenase